ncbi:MAG: tetratricopeptide repeat protein [Candidatus Sulfotelmatobacter sp.]
MSSSGKLRRQQKIESASEKSGAAFSPQKNVFMACLVLLVATLAFYNPVAHCGFVYSDDIAYVTGNQHVRAGLTWATVEWAFSAIHTGFWHPLTWLSHALDCQLFGLNAAGHHYVSLLLHTASAVLLFLVLLEATGAGWPSLVIAALFALHPENVESVAWASERKNVLSMFFFLWALWAYGRYVKRGGVRRYVGVVSLFALGLMAKPQIITLPFVLLLWDYWPLGRMFSTPSNVEGASTPRSFAYLVKEKVPLLLLAAACSVVTVIAQRQESALRTLGEYSFSARIGNAIVSYARYIGHTLWPMRLAPIYPHTGVPPMSQIAAAAVLLALVTAVVIWRRDLRYLLVGWCWFLGTLVPVIGIVQTGEQAMADRYAYLPMIGLFLLLVWPIAAAVEAKHIEKVWAAVPALMVLVTLGVLTYLQLAHWHDGETLWRYTIGVTERNYLAHDNLAMVLAGEGRPDEAIGEFLVSEQYHQYPPDQLLKIGLYEQHNRHFQGAIEQYQKVSGSAADARLRAAAWSQTGSAYIQMGEFEQARKSYENGLQASPNDPPSLVGSAMLAERDGNFSEAVMRLNQAMKVEPSDVGYLLLADALRHAGRVPEAQADEDLAGKISPNLDQARKNATDTQLFFGYKAN